MATIAGMEFYQRDEVTLDDLAVEALGDRIAIHTVVNGRRRTLFLLDPADVHRLAHALLRAAEIIARGAYTRRLGR